MTTARIESGPASLANKQRGFLQPPVIAPRRASTGTQGQVLNVQMRNPEPVPLTFTSQMVEVQPCALDATSQLQAVVPVNVQLPAGATSLRDLAIDSALTGAANCGLILHLTGAGPYPDAKDSEKWRSPGVGRAVSPDDMMHWDVYPYSEMLVYRSNVWKRKYAWKLADGVGGLSGVVRDERRTARCRS